VAGGVTQISSAKSLVRAFSLLTRILKTITTRTTKLFTAYVEVNEAFCGDSSFNGCGASFVPDVFTDAADSVSGFKDSCNEHDVCYKNCSVTREECEDQFRNNMYDECNGQFLCELLADLFYQGVTTLGEGVCQASRDPPVCTQAEYDTCTID
jgi:hypothetical protein